MRHADLCDARQLDRSGRAPGHGIAKTRRDRAASADRNGWRIQIALHDDGRLRSDRHLRGAGRRGRRPFLAPARPDGIGADANVEGVPGSRLSRDQPFAWLTRRRSEGWRLKPAGCASCSTPASSSALRQEIEDLIGLDAYYRVEAETVEPGSAAAPR